MGLLKNKVYGASYIIFNAKMSVRRTQMCVESNGGHFGHLRSGDRYFNSR
jgi:hypothetical protein